MSTCWGLFSSPLGVSDLSLRHAAGEGFLLGLRPDLGGVWLFWVDCREVAVLGVSGLGCVAFCVHVLGPVSSPLWVSDLSLRHAAGEGFLLGLRPDLGGVWLFWVDRREVAVLGVSGLGCVAFCVHVLGPVSSPLWVSDLSLRHAAGGGFLLGLRPDLGGVWLFWVDRREVAVLGMSGLGCVAFCVHVLGPVSSLLWVWDLSLRHAAGEGFLLGLRPDLGGVLAVLSRSPGGCCFGRVWARLRCVLCPRAGACFFSFMGFRLVTSARWGGGFFAGLASGFRWCLAVLSRSPGGCCFGRVWARLRCVLCPRAT